MLLNEYDKLELIDENMEYNIKDFLIKSGKKEYVNLTHDIIFLIYKKYDKIPLYSQNIIFPKNISIK